MSVEYPSFIFLYKRYPNSSIEDSELFYGLESAVDYLFSNVGVNGYIGYFDFGLGAKRILSKEEAINLISCGCPVFEYSDVSNATYAGLYKKQIR